MRGISVGAFERERREKMAYDANEESTLVPRRLMRHVLSTIKGPRGCINARGDGTSRSADGCEVVDERITI